MTSKLPQPETKRAFLVPAGETRRVATVHHYYETRLIEGAVDTDGKPVTEYEYIFKCFISGTERRWGTYLPLNQANSESEVN